MRKFFRYFLMVTAFISMSPVSSSFAGHLKVHRVAKVHHVAVQVDQNDPAVMNLALNNATNVVEY